MSRCTTAGLSIGPSNDANRKWVYVEQDPTAIGVNRRFDVPLVGDLRGVVPQLVEALRDTPRAQSPNLETLVKADAAELARVAEEAPSGRTPVHPARYVVEATKAFDEFAKDGIMVRDGGATVIFQWTYSQSKPRDVIWNQNFGHLGTGLPYAVGASIAEGRKRPVMLLTSDSAFLFHIAELETAARREPAAGMRCGRRPPVGPGGRRVQAHLRAAVAAARCALEQGCAVRQDRRGFRLPW